VERLQAVRARRDSAAVQHTLQELRSVCLSGANVMPAIVSCVKTYATIGEIADVWREVYGTYVPEAVRF
jgi:methylmalonyl-CoA mutase N-terminal domain/subunit